MTFTTNYKGQSSRITQFPLMQISGHTAQPICTLLFKAGCLSLSCESEMVIIAHSVCVCEAFVNLPKKSLSPALRGQDLQLLPLQTLALR